MYKIAFIIPTLERGGGAERALTSLATKLSETHDVTVVTLFEFESETLANISFVHLKMFRGGSWLQKLVKFFRLRSALKAELNKLEPHLVVTFLILPLFLLCSLPFRKYRLVISLRSSLTRLGRLYRWFVIKLCHFADVIHVVSEEMKSELMHISSPVVRIYAGHDFAKYDALANEGCEMLSENSRFVFGTVGRLIESKGQIHILKAFEQLVRQGLKVYLIILGDGPQRSVLQSYIKEKNLDKFVHMPGVERNVHSWLGRLDCFVFASYFEGMPNAVVEGYYHAKRIISVDCRTGPREILFPNMSQSIIQLPMREGAKVLIKGLGSEAGSVRDLEAQLHKEMLSIMSAAPLESMHKKEFVDEFSLENEAQNWNGLICELMS